MIVHPRLKHLSQSGQMGQMIASFDWKNTSLGDPETWSQSLVSILGIVLNNKIAMYVLWGKDQINFYNDAYAQILDKKHPAALGAKSIETWPEIWDTIGPLFGDVYSGKSVYFENMPLTVNVSGAMVDKFFTFSFTPIHMEDGTVGGVLDTVIDTTVEVKQQEIIKKSEEKFRNYQELSPSPFISLDKDWNISYMNSAALEVLNLPKETIGNNFWTTFPNLEDTIFGESYHKSMRGERSSFEGYYPTYDRWYRVITYGLQPGVAIAFQDITETKKLEERLNKAVASRDEFLSIASHELKTPITSLKIQAQSVMREMKKGNPEIYDPERIKKYFVQSDKQVTRITRLVDDMLDVSRIGSGKLKLELAVVDFKTILTETIERMSDQFMMSSSGKPKIKVKGENFKGSWDAFRIEQVINNLFTNAIRYGEGQPIDVQLEDHGDCIKLLVCDKGRGISKADQELIFERFMRAEDIEFAQGLGLGLFISKEIVLNHGGKIEVESSLGEGATFKVFLPKIKSPEVQR